VYLEEQLYVVPAAAASVSACEGQRCDWEEEVQEEGEKVYEEDEEEKEEEMVVSAWAMLTCAPLLHWGAERAAGRGA
jgi:hypothetical protein